MDPQEQLDAFRSMKERGLELLGIFHSHPAEPGAGGQVATGPSPTDVEEAAYPVVNLIWSRDQGQWQARGFWIEGGSISPVHLLLAADQ
jgi:proteasome lid subunit RPN8/RPN11